MPSPPPHFHTASEATCTKKYVHNKTKIENQHRRVGVGYKYTKILADVVTPCEHQTAKEASQEPREKEAFDGNSSQNMSRGVACGKKVLWSSESGETLHMSLTHIASQSISA